MRSVSAVAGPLRTAILILTLGLLAACASPGAGPTDPDGATPADSAPDTSTQPTTAPSASQGGDVSIGDPCQLLTAAEVGAAVGTQMNEGALQAHDPQTFGPGAECRWLPVTPATATCYFLLQMPRVSCPAAALFLFPVSEESTMQHLLAECATSTVSGVATLPPVSSIGDACWSKGRIYAARWSYGAVVVRTENTIAALYVALPRTTGTNAPAESLAESNAMIDLGKIVVGRIP